MKDKTAMKIDDTLQDLENKIDQLLETIENEMVKSIIAYQFYIKDFSNVFKV